MEVLVEDEHNMLRVVENCTSQLFSQHLEDYADNAAMIRGLDKKEGTVQEEVTHNPHVPELLSIQVPAVLNNSLDPRLSSILRVTHDHSHCTQRLDHTYRTQNSSNSSAHTPHS